MSEAAPHLLDQVYRREHGRVVATMIRLVGDFQLAEDLVAEAFEAALDSWPRSGVPDNPGGWLTRVARNRALDRLRRDRTARNKNAELRQLETLAAQEERERTDFETRADDMVRDDRLRLIFTCCHPALGENVQVALTLRTLCGLTTTEIARAFLVPEPTMAQRLVRAKKKILAARIPYRVPPPERLGERLMGVCKVIYLVFNEGYRATGGTTLVRAELCEEAIRLGTVVADLLADEPEVVGLVTLMMFHHARRDTRCDRHGDLVLLEDQDRTGWRLDEIQHAKQRLDAALSRGRPGPYQIQAAIGALHATAERPENTDWPQIALLYRRLLDLQPSAVVALNHAVAVAMAHGPTAGLALIDQLETSQALVGYALLHSAKADLLRRLEQYRDAARQYRLALELEMSAPERRFLERRLAQVEQ